MSCVAKLVDLQKCWEHVLTQNLRCSGCSLENQPAHISTVATWSENNCSLQNKEIQIFFVWKPDWCCWTVRSTVLRHRTLKQCLLGWGRDF